MIILIMLFTCPQLYCCNRNMAHGLNPGPHLHGYPMGALRTLFWMVRQRRSCYCRIIVAMAKTAASRRNKPPTYWIHRALRKSCRLYPTETVEHNRWGSSGHGESYCIIAWQPLYTPRSIGPSTLFYAARSRFETAWFVLRAAASNTQGIKQTLSEDTARNG